nr:MAG TPA: hypothetical protein [Caudoviricetes sp.]
MHHLSKLLFSLTVQIYTTLSLHRSQLYCSFSNHHFANPSIQFRCKTKRDSSLLHRSFPQLFCSKRSFALASQNRTFLHYSTT